MKETPEPNTIKIEQISREKAYARCDYCGRREPHIHYYIVAKTKKFKTFGACLIHTREEMVRFSDVDPQDFHSFCGGKSREEFLLPGNVRRRAKKIWEADNYTLSAETVTCVDLMDDNITEMVAKENFKGFIKK